ncbi:MAG TPA: hypothetical protein VFD92_25880 [Candidatus Binatia bacterium]|nr:hypothetical protein [Candidatus Binatia bacterium]
MPPVVTGFDRRTGRWDPATFDTPQRGISLYKLHGSFSWTTLDGEIFEDRRNTKKKLGQMVLGPGPKTQNGQVLPSDEFIAHVRDSLEHLRSHPDDEDDD